MNVKALAALFDNIRAEHQVDVMQPDLLGCTCGASLRIERGNEGQPLYNPIIRHHHEKQAEAVVGFLAAGDAL